MSEFTFRGPWFSSREACAYVTCKSMKGWYAWKARHRIISRANGSVAKADLDRALKIKRIRRMNPVSLANLRRRSHAAHSSAAVASTVNPVSGTSIQ